MKQRYLYMPLTPEQDALVRQAMADGKLTALEPKSLRWCVYSAREMWAYWHMRTWLALQPTRRRWMILKHRARMLFRGRTE